MAGHVRESVLEVVTRVSNSPVIIQHIPSYETDPRSSKKVKSGKGRNKGGMRPGADRAATQLQRSRGRG